MKIRYLLATALSKTSKHIKLKINRVPIKKKNNNLSAQMPPLFKKNIYS